MTQENKNLLLQDLCARLPYGVMCLYDCIIPGVMQISHAVGELNGIIPFEDTTGFMVNYHKVNALYDNIKPYLRPLSSMTEEEYKSVSWEGCSHTYNYSLKSGFRFVEIKTFTLNILNWLIANHFDYRGLIPMGLALEAKEGMYKIE